MVSNMQSLRGLSHASLSVHVNWAIKNAFIPWQLVIRTKKTNGLGIKPYSWDNNVSARRTRLGLCHLTLLQSMFVLGKWKSWQWKGVHRERGSSFLAFVTQLLLCFQGDRTRPDQTRVCEIGPSFPWIFLTSWTFALWAQSNVNFHILYVGLYMLLMAWMLSLRYLGWWSIDSQWPRYGVTPWRPKWGPDPSNGKHFFRPPSVGGQEA